MSTVIWRMFVDETKIQRIHSPSHQMGSSHVTCLATLGDRGTGLCIRECRSPVDDDDPISLGADKSANTLTFVRTRLVIIRIGIRIILSRPRASHRCPELLLWSWRRVYFHVHLVEAIHAANDWLVKVTSLVASNASMPSWPRTFSRPCSDFTPAYGLAQW